MRALVDKYNSLGEAQKKRGLIAVLLVLGLIGIWLSSQEDTESAAPLIPQEIVSPVSSTIFVHVVGEVLSPGLYQLPVGSRASDAIAKAGGLTTLAAQESVNLARNPRVFALLASKTLLTKVAHHGWADQSRTFYRPLDSEYLVFSVGKNDYGHPARSALSLAWPSGAEVLRTDKLGHIALGHDHQLRYRYSGKLTA